MAIEERMDSAARDTLDRAQDALESAGEKLKNGYDAAQRFARENELVPQLRDFVAREPWLAVAAAFTIGYVAARLVRRI